MSFFFKNKKKNQWLLPAIVVGFLFVLLPFLYNRNLYDPELSIRFIGLSVLTVLLSVRFLIVKTKGHNLSDLWIVKNYGAGAGLLFLLIAGVSVFRAYDPGTALYDWLRMVLLSIFLFQFLLLLNEFPKLKDNINVGVGIAVLIFSIFGAIDFYPSVINLFHGAKRFQVEYYFGSTLGNKNFYAETMFLSLPFLLDGFIRFNGFRKWLLLFSIAAAVGSIIVLQSVSVFIALLISFLLFVYLFRKFILTTENRSPVFSKKKIIAGISVCVVLLLGSFIFFQFSDSQNLKFKFTSLYKYLTADENHVNSKLVYGSFTERLLLWKHTVKMIADHPLFGVGISNWKLLITNYGNFGIDFMDAGTLRFEHPHSDYLLILAEQGILGLLIYLSIFFFVIKKIFFRIKSSLLSIEKLRYLFLLCGIIGFMLLSLFGFPMQRFYQMIFLMLFFTFTFSNENKSEETSKPQPFTFLILFFVSVFSVWFFMKRYAGEIHFKRALHEQLNKNWNGMEAEIERSKSFPFQSDLLATPLDWYSGFAVFYSGDINKAQTFFERAVKQNPFHVQAWNDLGTCYEQHENYVAAIDCYTRALIINPTFYNAKMNLIAAYFNSGKIEDAYQTIYQLPWQKGNKQYKQFLEVVLKAKLNSIVQSETDSIRKQKLENRLADRIYLFKLFRQAQTTQTPIDLLFIKQSKK